MQTFDNSAKANYPGRPDESNHRARNWICTVPGQQELDLAKLEVYASEKCKYMIVGKEVGKTGVPHLQVYMQLEKQTAGQTVKNQSKVLNMWMGIANSAVKSREYCMKDGDYCEFGTFDPNAGTVEQKKKASAKGGQVTKEQWAAVRDDIMEGADAKFLMHKYPHLYFKHHSGMDAGIRAANVFPRRQKKTCVHAYIGPPGVGKTTKAEELAGQFGSYPYFYNSPNKIWWSTYDGVSPVIMDDFHGEYPFGDFKKLLDKYPHQVPVHGSLINFNPEIVIITSNEMPGEWYREQVLKTHGLSALLRRINVLQVWDEQTKSFIDTDIVGLWNEGCLCPTKDPNEISATLELSSQSASEDPVFPPEDDVSGNNVVPNIPLSLPSSNSSPPKKRIFPPIPKPSKKVRPALRGKTIAQLTKAYGKTPDDPVVLDEDTDDVSSFSDSDEMDGGDSSVESISESY